YRDHRFDPNVDRQTGFRSRSILCVPLQIGNKRTGVVQVLNRCDGEPFTRDDLSLLELVASFIALAIENAREHQMRVEAQRLAVIGQTVSQLGHCIKNALQGLQGGSYLLDKHLSDHDASARTRAWAMLQRHISFLSDLVMNMLSYAKKRNPVCEMANVNVFCKDVAEMISAHAASQGVVVSFDLSEEMELVPLDGAGIKRCLYNLVTNAIDACESGKGQVVISTGCQQEDSGVFVSIQDNGVGIPPESLSRLCEAFYSTKGNRGTGLGLSVCKKIIEEHGGRIQFDSTVGKGTKVTLLLPNTAPTAGT
ncbi:MAG TPA: GAF domain-containing sensor histidine kinase, partial [bacterium]|nr:GAF domain-containing sensor histidine kinase [bacterium]